MTGLLDLVAVLSAGIFAGAALHVSLVEHPARIECYHFIERPAVFHHGRIAEAMQAPRWDRFMREWAAMHQSPLSAVWAFAAIDEMLSALYERAIGSLP
jgi:hypothetical protein